ncbi:MAG: pilZ domain protein [Gammaproteobacteria bacterium]|jgi:hypothetical protein|nr:pilZ domain protein [Gammaproteobacteria bacterium]
MTAFKKLLDKRWIAVGKSLPFSIYDSQRKLLLAQGHVVESERSLERLQSHGEYYKPDSPDDEPRFAAAAVDSPEVPPADPLQALSRDYSNIFQRARYGVKISPKETGESYLCWVIGVSHENRCLVMTAPARADKALAPVNKGQVWFCRMFSATTVFRFRGAILKVAFDPYPYLHILVPEVIERRLVRQVPRALVSLQATLVTPETHNASIVDLSVGGARIAVEKSLALEVGSTIQLHTTVDVIGRQHEIDLQAKVAVAYGGADSRHPGITFYGLCFEAPSERHILVLHGYVQQQLAREYDGLGQVLSFG